MLLPLSLSLLPVLFFVVVFIHFGETIKMCRCSMAKLSNSSYEWFVFKRSFVYLAFAWKSKYFIQHRMGELTFYVVVLWMRCTLASVSFGLQKIHSNSISTQELFRLPFETCISAFDSQHLKSKPFLECNFFNISIPYRSTTWISFDAIASHHQPKSVATKTLRQNIRFYVYIWIETIRASFAYVYAKYLLIDSEYQCSHQCNLATFRWKLWNNLGKVPMKLTPVNCLIKWWTQQQHSTTNISTAVSIFKNR